VRRIRSFARDRRGATAVEYGLICALIFLAIASSIRLLSTSVVNLYGKVSNGVSNASNS